MGLSAFTDRNQPPTEEDIQTALGDKYRWWQRLRRFLLETFQMEGDLNCGGKNYGWHRWYRRAGRSITTIYPQVDRLTVQIVLGKVEVEKAIALDLGEHVAAVLRDTPQFHDGRWLFIPLESDRDVEDAEQLLLLKPKPRLKAK
jgi:hypothetical protein